MSPPRNTIHRKIYPLRVSGMALGGLAVSSVLIEQQATGGAWVVMVLTCLLWPHLAYLHARLSPDPHRAETRNLLIDSAISGAWVPLMNFCLLPSAVLVIVTTFDKLSTGIRRLWLRSLPGMLGMAALLTLWLQPVPLLESSVFVVLCTLPLLLMHTTAVSVASYRLIRTVSRQNRQLEELRRTDLQTGLHSRDHWTQLATAALGAFRADAQPVCLLLLDIDRFKSVNDRYGHVVGDEVIRAVGMAIRQGVRAADAAGRTGGDEFAVLCPNATLAEAQAVAQRMRSRIEAVRLRELPELRISASIGVAAVQPGHEQLRDWMSAADSALYQAKGAGRNQVVGAAAATAPVQAVPTAAQ